MYGCISDYDIKCDQFDHLIHGMVRLKHRYILFDVVYPPVSDPRTSGQREKMATFSKSPKQALLNMHGQSPASVNSKSIAMMLRRAVDDHFGAIIGAGCGQLIIVKYFSNKTSTGIIRCNRGNFQYIMAAMAMITKVDNYNAIMRCVHVSGTIKKCEKFSIRRNRQLIIEMGQDKEMKSNFDELLQMFSNDGDEEEES